ncbi:MAG: PEGA domain-containing protein [Cryomorphaceae bacterium]|nr:MAG: PEGA domain-containing protein [Cryomorphaceae bacterium]
MKTVWPHSFLLTFLLILGGQTAIAQLNEFEISKLPTPNETIVQANTQFSDNALLLIYSDLDGLQFRSSMGAINKQTYNSISNRYEVLCSPVKQIIFVAKKDFIEQRIENINPNPKSLHTYKVTGKQIASNEPGNLQIITQPEGCTIFLNEIALGDKTPFEGALPAATYKIRVIKQDYHSIDTAVTLSAGAATSVYLKMQEDQRPNSVTDIDGNEYKTIKIGNQIWMSENLKTGRYRNGDPIPNISQRKEWRTSEQGGWCWYDNNSEYENPYGKLYNWYSIGDSRGVCPAGWHVPNNQEWNLLIKYLGGNRNAGLKMKSADRTFWKVKNQKATNSSGFNALPGGLRQPGRAVGFQKARMYGFFWSSDSHGKHHANMLFVRGIKKRIRKGTYLKRVGLSVRCIKD